MITRMFEPHIAWVIAGFFLVILELLTGTVYLLMLGLAAFAGAAVAFAGGSFLLQALVAAALGLAGVFWVRNRRPARGTPMASLDAGQPVTFESWVNPVARQARVRYRDTLWDAFVAEDEAAAPVAGDVLYISGTEGSTLNVARRRPAAARPG